MKFIQAVHHGGTQSRVIRIVIHCTVSPCVEGGAENVARYFQTAAAGGSAHYTVDPGETVASVRETVVAHHAPPNTNTIGVELCDPQKGSSSRWNDANHKAMLIRAAALVRQIAARWDVPLRRLSVAEVRAGKRGICGHVDVSNAFGKTDHSDPGTGFPWDRFMKLVQGDAAPDDPNISWTETLVKDLPLLRPGADNFDVKTVRACLFARDRVPATAYAADGLEAWLKRTTADPQLVEMVKAFQHIEGLDPDGWVGQLTWPPLLRLA